MITKISFSNFKLFKEKQELLLKPITVLIGKNNSGKTAVLKLPTLVSNSLSGSFNEAIKINDKTNGFVNIASEYRDLVYNRELKPGDTVDFEISNNIHNQIFKQLNVKIELPFDEIKDKPIVRDWEYLENSQLTYKNKKTDSFKGFVNTSYAVEDMKLNFDYIEALREKPQEEYSFDSSEINKIGLKGENAYQILIKDKVIGTGEILKEVSNWYKENFENWAIEIIEDQIVNSNKMKFSFCLSNSSIKQINIINTGQGINQALPLITRSYMKDEEPVIIIVEEPESHLHPAAHGNLAQRFVESIIEDDNKRYLIETHSENFILRLQNLIADPDFPFTQDDIQIYYVDYDENKQESVLKTILIEEDGEIEDWPENVFNENVDEVFKLRRNQKKRRENASQN
jgi:predicted ATPase